MKIVGGMRVRVASPKSAFNDCLGVVRATYSHALRGDYLNVLVKLFDQPWPFNTHAVKFHETELVLA